MASKNDREIGELSVKIDNMQRGFDELRAYIKEGFKDIDDKLDTFATKESHDLLEKAFLENKKETDILKSRIAQYSAIGAFAMGAIMWVLSNLEFIKSLLK